MTTIDASKLILPRDIREGDAIRKHYTDGSSPVEYVADGRGHGYGAVEAGYVWELLDRPRKIVHEKGKTLYFGFERKSNGILVGDAGTVDCDHFEGDSYCHVTHDATGYSDGYPIDSGAYPFTDVKPPAPETYVRVPQSAIDALISEDERAYETHGDPRKNDIRRAALGVFRAAVGA